MTAAVLSGIVGAIATIAASSHLSTSGAEGVVGSTIRLRVDDRLPGQALRDGGAVSLASVPRKTVEGTLVAVDRDSITVSFGSGGLVRAPQGLEGTQIKTRRDTKWAEGALWGALSGGVLGGAIGFAGGSDPAPVDPTLQAPGYTRGTKGAIGIGLGVGIGSLIGMMIGSSNQTDRWDYVRAFKPKPTITVAPSRTGTAVGVQIRF